MTSQLSMLKWTPAKRRAIRAAAAATTLALGLAGCGVDRAATGSIPSADYRVTHPIELADAARTLDIYPSPARMDPATRARIKEFAKNFRAEGNGEIEILMPRPSRTPGLDEAALAQVRGALAEAGLRGYVGVGEYPAAPGEAATPIRLAFRALVARVPHRCGEWPDDIASGNSLRGWRNNPYWNYGCATQKMMAAQVADPRDLTEPRAETPADVEMRRLRIEKVRAGADPGASWKTSNSNIGGVGN